MCIVNKLHMVHSNAKTIKAMIPMVLIQIIGGESKEAPEELEEELEAGLEEVELEVGFEEVGNAPVALSHLALEGTENVLERTTSEHCDICQLDWKSLTGHSYLTWNNWPSPPLNWTIMVALAPFCASATPRELIFTGKQASPWAFITVKGMRNGMGAPEDVLLNSANVVGFASKEMSMSTELPSDTTQS